MPRKNQSKTDALPPIDQQMARPDAEPLPTRLDPAGPEAHGYPADPKLVHEKQGTNDHQPADPAPADIGRSA